MPKSPPQFNFYYNDWLGGTMHLNHVEKSCYLTLLIYQWQHGYIPLTERNRMGSCNVQNVGEWRHIWDQIKDKFDPFELDETTVAWRNARMHEDREKAITRWQAMVKRNQQNGKKGGRPRKPSGFLLGSQKKPKSDMDMDINTKKKKKSATADEMLAGVSEGVAQVVKEWLAYKAERREGYTPTSEGKAISRILNRIESHGLAVVRERIDLAMASGWKGWDHGEWPATQTETFREV